MDARPGAFLSLSVGLGFFFWLGYRCGSSIKSAQSPAADHGRRKEDASRANANVKNKGKGKNKGRGKGKQKAPASEGRGKGKQKATASEDGPGNSGGRGKLARLKPRIERAQPLSVRRKDGLLRYASNLKSQGGEDGILGRIFAAVLPPTQGAGNAAALRWCVEIGSWDGQHNSNSFALLNTMEGEGGFACRDVGLWSGVLIEANAERSRQARRYYAARGGHSGHNDGTAGNDIAPPSLDPGDSRRGQGGDPRTVTAVTAEVGLDGERSLQALLSVHAPGLPAQWDKAGGCGFGVLSIDVDGIDYWVWESLGALRPAVVVIEFNPTIPNHVTYVQVRDESIRQGSSLAALIELAGTKGYRLVETTLYNAFFVCESLWDSFGPHLPDGGQAASVHQLHQPSMTTDLWQLYDGTLEIAGCKKLLWHRIKIDKEKLQVLPPAMRGTFPFAPP